MMFRKNYDIAVCGGGIAGVAAAVAAARRGCKTVLIEKTLQPGGLATLQRHNGAPAPFFRQGRCGLH